MRGSFLFLAAVAGLSMSASTVRAVDFTSGYRFFLRPGEPPLHDVHVLAWAGQAPTYNLQFETASIFNKVGEVNGNSAEVPGFYVGTGQSDFNLQKVYGPDHIFLTLFVIIGLRTDAQNHDHVVLSSPKNLLNVPLLTILPNNQGYSEADYIDWLKTGYVGDGTSTGIVYNFESNVIRGYYGGAFGFGHTQEIYTFSDGQLIDGATVSANDYGVPIPEPASVGLLGAGACGLLIKRRRSRS